MKTDDASVERRRSLAEIAVVIVVSWLAYLVESAMADRLPWGEEARGLSAVLIGTGVALWLSLRGGGSLADLGFKRPKSWLTAPLWALGILVVFIAAQLLVPAIIAPIFDLPPPDMSRYDSIRGNLPAALALALILPVTAAIPEEILYRGFLIDRLTRIIGIGGMNSALVVVVQAVIFGSIHFQWGLGGVIMTTIMGVVWGAAFILCGRNLWIVIAAHSSAHVLLVMQLYSSPAPA